MSDETVYPVEHLVTFDHEPDDVVDAWVPLAPAARGPYTEAALRKWIETYGGGRTGRFRLFDTTFGAVSVTEFEVTADTVFNIARVEHPIVELAA